MPEAPRPACQDEPRGGPGPAAGLGPEALLRGLQARVEALSGQPVGDAGGQSADPLSGVLDRLPIGMAIFDREAELRVCNRAWAEFVERSTRLARKEPAPDMRASVRVAECVPWMRPPLEKVLAGETVRVESGRLEVEGSVTYWDLLWKPLVVDSGAVACVALAVDVTDWVVAQQELERRVEERRREIEQHRRAAEELREILVVLNSGEPLPRILEQIAARTARLLDSAACSIARLDSSRGLLTIQAAHRLPAEYVGDMWLALGEGPAGQALLSGRPVALSDLLTRIDDREYWRADAERQRLVRSLADSYRAVLAVPLMIKQEAYGAIGLYYSEPRDFSPREIDLALTVADHVALAIENARLRGQAEQAAAEAERNRVARKLHDSVTQALLSANTIAQLLPGLWEKDADEGRRRLAELGRLTCGALAEMRTLLLELRPEALREARLADLLLQLAEAVGSRAHLEIQVLLEGRPSLPPEVTVAFYRIAQEALGNVAAHSGDQRATLSLRQLPALGRRKGGRGVAMCISDLGRGFDLSRVNTPHVGLDVMRERAAAIGARLEIETEAGRGTSITVIWPGDRQRSRHERAESHSGAGGR